MRRKLKQTLNSWSKIQLGTFSLERNVLNNWAPPCPVHCSCTAFMIYVTLHSVVHTECYEHDEVTVNSWHVYVPLGHLAERTRENQREWLVGKCPVARNKMKYIVAKIYVKINYSMTPFALDIRKWDARGLVLTVTKCPTSLLFALNITFVLHTVKKTM